MLWVPAEGARGSSNEPWGRVVPHHAPGFLLLPCLYRALGTPPSSYVLTSSVTCLSCGRKSFLGALLGVYCPGLCRAFLVPGDQLSACLLLGIFGSFYSLTVHS